jgi:hypothetical protein
MAVYQVTELATGRTNYIVSDNPLHAAVVFVSQIDKGKKLAKNRAIVEVKVNGKWGGKNLVKVECRVLANHNAVYMTTP